MNTNKLGTAIKKRRKKFESKPPENLAIDRSRKQHLSRNRTRARKSETRDITFGMSFPMLAN